MQCVGCERDVAQGVASGVVVPFEITLKYQTPVPHHDDPVEIPNAVLSDSRFEQFVQIGCKACFAWRNGKPIILSLRSFELIAPRECPLSLQRIGFCIVHDVSLSPRRLGHHDVNLAAAALRTYQTFAQPKTKMSVPYRGGHLGGVGLDLMQAGSAPQNRPDLGDHVVPLICGGPDAVSNLQWQK